MRPARSCLECDGLGIFHRVGNRVHRTNTCTAEQLENAVRLVHPFYPPPLSLS